MPCTHVSAARVPIGEPAFFLAYLIRDDRAGVLACVPNKQSFILINTHPYHSLQVPDRFLPIFFAALPEHIGEFIVEPVYR